jgi:hypothetical protein
VGGSATRFAVRVSRTGFRGRIDLVASAAAVGGLGCLPFELLEDVLHRFVVADRTGYPAVVVLACDNDGAVAKPSSGPQTPRPHSAFVHYREHIRPSPGVPESPVAADRGLIGEPAQVAA